MAGAGSGFVNSFISCPFELAKINMQNQGVLPGTFTRAPPRLVLSAAHRPHACRLDLRTQAKQNRFAAPSTCSCSGTAPRAWQGPSAALRPPSSARRRATVSTLPPMRSVPPYFVLTLLRARPASCPPASCHPASCHPSSCPPCFVPALLRARPASCHAASCHPASCHPTPAPAPPLPHPTPAPPPPLPRPSP